MARVGYRSFNRHHLYAYMIAYLLYNTEFLSIDLNDTLLLAGS